MPLSTITSGISLKFPCQKKAKSPAAAPAAPPRRSHFREEFEIATAEYPPGQGPKPLTTRQVLMRFAKEARELYRLERNKHIGLKREAKGEIGESAEQFLEACQPPPEAYCPCCGRLYSWLESGAGVHHVHERNMIGGENISYFSPNVMDNSELGLQGQEYLEGRSFEDPSRWDDGESLFENEEQALLWASNDQACLARFAPLWQDPYAEMVDQSLFSDFDFDHRVERRLEGPLYWGPDERSLPQRIDSGLSIRDSPAQKSSLLQRFNAYYQEDDLLHSHSQNYGGLEDYTEDELGLPKADFDDRRSQQEQRLFEEYAHAVYDPRRFCERPGLFPQVTLDGSERPFGPWNAKVPNRNVENG